MHRCDGCSSIESGERAQVNLPSCAMEPGTSFNNDHQEGYAFPSRAAGSARSSSKCNIVSFADETLYATCSPLNSNDFCMLCVSLCNSKECGRVGVCECASAYGEAGVPNSD